MKKIDGDHFDARRNIPKAVDTAISQTAIFGAPLAIGLASNATVMETAYGIAVAAGMTGLSTVELASAGIDLLPKGQIEDKKLGYHAQPFVYRGERNVWYNDDRTRGNGHSLLLSPGDNFFWLNLPELKIKKPAEGTNSQALADIRNEIWSDATITSLRDFMHNAADTDWKAIALPGIESMPAAVRDKLPSSMQLKMTELFDNKGIKPQKLGEKKVAVVTRKELEAFFEPKPVEIIVPRSVMKYEKIKVPVIEQELKLSELAQSLESRRALDLIQAIYDATDPKFQNRLLFELGQKLDQIMVDELQKPKVDDAVRISMPFWKSGGGGQPRPQPEANAPDRAASPKWMPDRRRTHSDMMIKPGKSGEKYVFTFNHGGGYTSKPVSEALRVPKSPSEEQIKSRQLNQGQVAYMIAEVIKKDGGIEGLFKSVDVVKEVERDVWNIKVEDVKDIIYKGMDIKPVDVVVQEAIDWEMKIKRRKDGPPGPSFFEWRRFLHEAKTIKPKLQKIAAAAAILAASSLAGDYFTPRPTEEAYSAQVDASQQPPGFIVDISRTLQKMAGDYLPVNISRASNEIANRVSPFEPRLPSDQLLWKVKEVDGMSSSGYYSLSTSNTYNNGEWELNKSKSKKLDLPDKISGPQLILNQVERLNPATGYTFKIPIKHGTKIGALEIKDFDNKKIIAEVDQLSDGTVQVTIPPFSTITPVIQTQVSLVPSTDRGVHATKAVEPIDLSKLSEKARQALNKGFDADEKFSDAIVQAIKDSHKYSLKPKDLDKLKPIQSAEDRVNVEAEWTECWCYTCNELNTLLSSHNPNGVPVNLALGYMHNAQTPGSKTVYASPGLMADTAHAWGVDAFSRILDATPGEIAGDKLTEKYILQLQRNPPPPPPPPTPATPATPIPAVATAQSYINELFPTSTPKPPTATTTPSSPTATSNPPTSTPAPPKETSTPEKTPTVLPATVQASPTPSPSPEIKTDTPKSESWLDSLPNWTKPALAASVAAGALGALGGRRWLRRSKPAEAPLPEPQPEPQPEPEQEPEPVTPPSYQNLESGDALVVISGKEQTISKEDIMLGKQFLSWITHGPRSNLDLSRFTTEQLEAGYSKTPGDRKPKLTLDNLRFNTRPENIRRYLSHASLFEESAHLTQDQAIRMRELAKTLLELQSLPVKISEV